MANITISLKELDVDALLVQLTLEEKVALTAGKDFWHTVPIPRLNIPSIRLSDGPNGVRGIRFFDSVPAACLPCATAIGATFDKKLVYQLGGLLGDEARAKGAHCILGPTINIQRSPLGGRGFESFSEDPVLSGHLAAHYCKGVEEKGVVATPKHFVCNDQEHKRMLYSAIVTQRALREIYLLPFMIAIRLAHPGAVMTAYNQINGVHLSDDPHLLQDILRVEWGWRGLVISDWFGTYSTSQAIRAGLDLEMPGPTRWRGPALEHAVSCGKVKTKHIDDRVRNILEFVNRGIRSGIPVDAKEGTLERDEDKQLMRRAAGESIVLLKNQDAVLPFKKTRRTAIIGPNAKLAAICGGGSASLNAYYTVTPFEGISATISTDGNENIQIDYAAGVYSHQFLPYLRGLQTIDGRVGFIVKVYNEPPTASPQRRMLEERLLTDSNVFFLDYVNPELNDIWYADAETVFTPDEDGLYDFGLSVQGTGALFVDGELLVDNTRDQKAGSSFIGAGTVEEIGSKELIAGKQYRILVQWASSKTSTIKTPGTIEFGHGGFRFSGCKRLDVEFSIAEAAQLARGAEQVVVIAGLSGEWESEGRDRDTMDLPPNSDRLISAVLEANPNAVIVIQSGTPVAMPWVDNAKAVLQSWYGGNETGNGIADVIFGDVNPSGKLPLTYPRRVQENPAYLNFHTEGGRVLYGEDIYVGYRYYDKIDSSPLFAFGHGLSYTTFELSDLQVEAAASGSPSERSNQIAVKVKVVNTGPVRGAEVVQVYIAPPSDTAGVKRPIKELKGFEKIELDPGADAVATILLDSVLDTSYFDEDNGSWCSPQGVYKILVGTSSRDSFLEHTFEVKRTTYWSGLQP